MAVLKTHFKVPIIILDRENLFVRIVTFKMFKQFYPVKMHLYCLFTPKINAFDMVGKSHVFIL